MFQMNNCAKYKHKCTSYGQDKLNLWPFYHLPSDVTLAFKLPEQTFQMNNCARLYQNPHINVEVIAGKSAIYDHLIIWPLSVTLSFNILEQIF